MSEIDPVELSGLVDGELSAERAAEVRRALAADPSLRAEQDELLELDRRCREAADVAAFRPRIHLPPQPSGISPWLLAVAVVVLLGLYLLPKLTDAFLAGVVLHSAALAAVAVAVVKSFAWPSAMERGQS